MALVPADVEAALTELGIELGRSDGTEVYGICPGHAERLGHPDFHATNWSVRRDTGEHHCFSCGYGGKFPSLVVDVLDCSRWEALSWIRRQGISHVEVEPVPVEPPRWGPRISEARFLSFDVPPDWALAERRLIRESVERYGIRWDSENDAWLLPIREADGTLLGWQRKSQRERFFNNYPRGKNRKKRCVFGLQQLGPGQTAILVESPLDCLRIASAGIDGAVSPFGVEVTDFQMELILSRTDRIIVAFDNDAAGARVTRLVCNGSVRDNRQSWARQFRSFRIWPYPEGVKDPGDQTDEQILASYSGARPAVLVRGMVDGLHRTAPSVSGGVPRRNGQLRKTPGRITPGWR